ncbi:hypothetical protein [Lactiplantibacillus argentoratensis]|uniref:hypothetical protein n=1 Tax=Lactiplantibacillus argentoratensis TaxID=271881 RepID=UPI001D06A5AB|nr:hypothetical protein [Lactiplantibacillus argentoratensis]MCB7464371.1 hypothetical protein [Lactiplantibacillus argentoratensis]
MTIAETQLAAEQASRDQDWSKAASLWEQVYQAQQKAAINYELVQALVADQQYVAAANYASEFEAQYLATDAAADLYLNALIANHDFISARIMVRARPASAWTATAIATLNAAERTAEQTLGTTLTTTMRHFYHLSDQPVQKQVTGLQAARHLPYERYLTAAKFLLVDPFLHPLTRVEVLYTLYQLQVPETVKMQWLLDEQILTLCPAKLVALGQDETSKAVYRVLEARLGDRDVFLYESLRELLQLQLMYLYPRAAQVITDATAWINILISQQTGDPLTEPNDQTEKMMKVQQKIQQFSLDLQS